MSAESDTPYRPVSGLAIAGFGLALLYALGVLAAAVVALRSRLPLQLDALWLLAPLLAAGLSLAGLIQVRKSEGTRAGGRLARWGLGLSAAVGLGYLAYHAATEEALRQQATGFADGWFQRLRQRQTAAAFWETLDPAQRDLAPALTPRFLKQHPDIAGPLEEELGAEGRFNLASSGFQELLRQFPALKQEIDAYIERRYVWGTLGQPGPLATFQTRPMIQFIERWGEQAEIEPQGVRSWSFVGAGSQGRYQVVLGYRIRTPEGHADATVMTLASQLPDDPRRHWQVLMAETDLRTHLMPTELGRQALVLSDSSRRFAEEWLAALARKQRDEAFLGTRPPEERLSLGAIYAAQLLLSALAQPLTSATLATQPEAARLLYLPGFADHAAGRLVDGRNLQADPAIRPIIQKHLKALFAEPPPPQSDFPSLASPPEIRMPAAWRIEGDTAIFDQVFFLRIAPRYACDGTVQVATRDPQVLAALRGKGNALPADPGWWVAGLKLRLAGITKKE